MDSEWFSLRVGHLERRTRVNRASCSKPAGLNDNVEREWESPCLRSSGLGTLFAVPTLSEPALERFSELFENALTRSRMQAFVVCVTL